MYSVIVCDLFHSHEPDHAIEIAGFPTQELAIEYARRRVRDSIEGMRQAGQSHEDLRALWHSFGEDCRVIGPGGLLYWASSELETFIAQPATPQEQDWQGIYRYTVIPNETGISRAFSHEHLESNSIPDASRYWAELLKRCGTPVDGSRLSQTSLMAAIRARRVVGMIYRPDGYGDGDMLCDLVTDFRTWERKVRVLEEEYRELGTRGRTRVAVFPKPLPEGLMLHGYKDDWHFINCSVED